MSDKSFTTAEVGSHNNDEKGYWLIVENNVYDVTSALFSLSLPPFSSSIDLADGRFKPEARNHK